MRLSRKGSPEGQTLIYFGLEGEDYDVVDGKPVSKLEGVALSAKYPVIGLLGSLASWGENFFNLDYPAGQPDEAYRNYDLNIAEQAKATGELPAFDMRITYMSTPLKDQFIIYPADDLISVMMGSEPVEKMVEDLLNSYNEKGLEEMITEVNQKAAELGY